MVNKFIWFMVLLLCLTGCPFDGGREFDLQLPGNIIVENSGNQTVQVTAVESAPGATATFVLDPFTLKPGQVKNLRVPEDAFNTIKAKNINAYGTCKDKNTWQIQPGQLQYSVLDDWTVKVELSPCN